MIDEPNEILLSVGSNLGDRERNILDAYALLVQSEILFESELSDFYETEPYGEKDQPDFLNAAICGKTYSSATEVLLFLKSIEYFVGRNKRAKWKEREIDLDILIFGNYVIETDKLIIPHQQMHLRKFVLVPANDICPNMLNPYYIKTVEQMLSELDDNSRITKYIRKYEN